MSNYKKNKNSNTSIFTTWVLIVLLCVGTFFLMYNYSANHSKFLENTSFADTIGDAFGKGAGKVTHEDLSSVESFTILDFGNAAIVNMGMDGYNDAYDAYNKEGITEEEKKALVDPATLIKSGEITDTNIYNDLKHFTGLTTAYYLNYTSVGIDRDVLAYSAENFPALTEFVSSGYIVKDLKPVESLPALTTLTVTGTPLSDISSVSTLKNLEYLDLSGTGLKDISALSNLDNSKIKTVYLTDNEITDWSPLDHIDADKVIKVVETEEDNKEESKEDKKEDTAE